MKQLDSSKISSQKTFPEVFDILDNIAEEANEEQNEVLLRAPDESEVKEAIFALSGESASSPDGFTGTFYQTCWEIVKNDVIAAVQAFFGGQELPRFVTHTNLVLLSKKDHVNSFSDVRPISLSNFINKVISRVSHERMVLLLPRLISLNQTGFIKGGTIVENVLLAQEIIRDIRKDQICKCSD